MFLGHYAVGFVSKRLAPRTSLGALMAAVQLPDLIWPIFLLLGWERARIEPGNTAFTPLAFEYYPWTHSLLAVIVWGIAFALVYYAVTRYRGGAMVLAIAVVSHWLLDAIVHRPDLPLYPGSSVKVGLGLWKNIPATLVLETVMFVVAVWIYLGITRPLDRVGRWGLWVLIVLLVLLQAGNAMSEPPATTRALALFAMTGWLVPLWAWWVDRHRVADDGVR
jgi:membrane-bound metal-dependent hydrolase YbcI (DUF457 family)